MENEQINPTPENTAEDYIQAIEELRSSTVSREEYDKIRQENKRLLKSLVNGESIDIDETAPADIKELRKKLYGGDVELSDVEYARCTLDLRQALIDAGERDPFLPWGKNIAPTPDDVAAATRVAEVLQSCLEYSNGDNAVFLNELQRRMIDANPVGGKRR